MPFNALLGIRISKPHRDGITIECAVRDELRTANGAGFMHGGATATMADAAVGIALMRHLGGRRPTTTVELKINYFRPLVNGTISLSRASSESGPRSVSVART